MNDSLKKFALGLALAAGLVTSSARAADEDRQKLEAGETVVRLKGKSAAREAQVAALFTSPGEKIWALIEDCEKYPKTMLRIIEAKQLSRDGNKVRCKTKLSLPWPMNDLNAVTDAIHTVVPGKKWERKWKMVEGEGDFHVNEGSWTITPYKDGVRTLLVYKTRVQPKVEVSDELRTMAQKNELPKLFRHLKAQLGEE